MNTDTAAPANLPAVLASVQEALRGNNLGRAVELADAALASGLEHPLLMNLVAERLQIEGRFGDALDLLHRALDIAPNDAFVLNSIGNCLSKVGAHDEALLAFDSALSIQPDLPQAHHGRGLALSSLGRRSEAYRAHRQAALLAPGFPDPNGALAALYVEDGDAEQASDFARRALAVDPHQTAAILALATLEFREGDYAGALARLDARLGIPNLPPLHLSAIQRLRADALDELGQPAAAMEAYQAANAARRQVYDPEAENRPELGLEHCTRLLGYFREARRDDWQAAPGSLNSPAAGHVFLVGFPRSGTTLLEQVLASLPNVVALEERPTLDPAARTYFDQNATIGDLARMDAATAERERDAYWQRVRDEGAEPDGKTFIDKLPLNTIYLPLVAKLFPDAKVILAIRDPRDVVVSCFRRRFAPNAMVVEFTDLERTARMYDAVMQLADLYRGLTDLAVHEHKHERLVEDFDAETRALCDFIGVPWTEAVRDFASTAQQREIRTPSAPQVRRGLYRDAIGQWRRYGDAIDPIKPILAPWVRRFGYPET